MENIGREISEYIMAQMPSLAAFALKVLLCIVIYFAGKKVINWLVRAVRRILERGKVEAGAVTFTASVVKIVLYLILVFAIAVQFGVKESSVAAVVASGGVAIGLALQGGLSNLAGGVIILILKPFVVGDYIIESTNQQEGTVVKVDLFYTTLSTVDNRRITVPNGTLTSSSITNVTSQDRRKLEIKVTISYQSDLLKAKEILNRLMHADESIRSDEEMQVFVDQLAADGVVLGMRAWVKTEEYWPAKWRMNEQIKLTFDAEGIELPYPQLDVHIRQ